MTPEWYTTAAQTTCTASGWPYDPPTTTAGVREPRNPTPPHMDAQVALSRPPCADPAPSYRHTI